MDLPMPVEDDTYPNPRLLLLAALGSLLLHLALGGAAWLVRRMGVPPPAVEITRIHLVPAPSEAADLRSRLRRALPEPRTRQIVSIRKPSTEMDPGKARFVSEWAQRVERESLARGAGRAAAGGGAGGQAPSPRPPDLVPSMETMNRIAEAAPPQTAPQPDPGVEAGSVTLLNTKAFRYAGFVRRVAYRIFDQWNLEVHSTVWFKQDLDAVQSSPVVAAVLDERGHRLAVQLVRSSGSPKFDRVALAACQEGAWDRNPPPGARAADGRIHFYFSVFPDVLEVALGD